jgi:hypothetical protein
MTNKTQVEIKYYSTQKYRNSIKAYLFAVVMFLKKHITTIMTYLQSIITNINKKPPEEKL